MKVKSECEITQSCSTLHDPMDCSLLGSSIHGIFQARVLEWVAIAFSVSDATHFQLKVRRQIKGDSQHCLMILWVLSIILKHIVKLSKIIQTCILTYPRIYFRGVLRWEGLHIVKSSRGEMSLFVKL